MTGLILPDVSRRSFLKTGLVVGAGLTFGVPTLLKAAPLAERKLYLYNQHTGEWFKQVYKAAGEYDPDALKLLSHIMRDRRTGKEHPMNPALYDLLDKLHAPFGSHRPLELVCGFRSEETNRKLRSAGRGVAKNSLHMSGRAVDVRLQGVKLSKLRDAARSLRLGGVGFYPKSNFVHVDIREKPYYW